MHGPFQERTPSADMRKIADLGAHPPDDFRPNSILSAPGRHQPAIHIWQAVSKGKHKTRWRAAFLENKPKVGSS